MQQPLINFDICKRQNSDKVCPKAGNVCSKGALYCDFDTLTFNPSLCNGCKSCVDNCPAQAIKILEVDLFISDSKKPRVPIKDE